MNARNKNNLKFKSYYSNRMASQFTIRIGRWKQSTALLTLFFFTGCAVGPNFKKPAAPQVKSFTSKPIRKTAGIPKVQGEEPQEFIDKMDIPGEWWTLFQSKPLNDLIEKSLKNNHDLKAAQAALRVAHENMLAQKGSYYPSLNATFNASRQKTSPVLAPIPNNNETYFSLFTPQVNVSYLPDLFGLNRRTVESLKAQSEQSRFALIATDITLTSNVVAAAIQEASLRDQIAATRHLIAINEKILQMVRNQFMNGGSANLVDIATQESQLAQTRANLPPLLKQLAVQRDLLAVLSGEFPNQELSEKFELSSLKLPEKLPLTLPSQLVEQRPDVRQAEENFHAACAQVGIARANRFPSFPLSANAGATALSFASLFAGGVGLWTLAGGLVQPIFQGGTLMHQEKAARAAYQQASEQYKTTVLTAFQNVADVLNALEQDAQALKESSKIEKTAQTALKLAQLQWESGRVNYLTVLTAEQAYQQAMINLVQAKANRYTDTAALFQALGGGWWNRKEFIHSSKHQKENSLSEKIHSS